jgi:hypothetical protein
MRDVSAQFWHKPSAFSSVRGSLFDLSGEVGRRHVSSSWTKRFRMDIFDNKELKISRNSD